MKFISPKLHAILDYLVVVFLFAAPTIFPSLSGDAKMFSYILGGIHLVLTLLTAFSGGILKIIPLPIHGMIEFFVSIILGVLAFSVFKNNGADQVYYAGFALAVLVVFIVTDYKGVRD